MCRNVPKLPKHSAEHATARRAKSGISAKSGTRLRRPTLSSLLRCAHTHFNAYTHASKHTRMHTHIRPHAPTDTQTRTRVNVVTGLPCVCLSVMIGTDRHASCLPFRHVPGHACCWQETAVADFLRAVSVRRGDTYEDVDVAWKLLPVALLPVRGCRLAAMGRASCHARCARTADVLLGVGRRRRCVLRRGN